MSQLPTRPERDRIHWVAYEMTRGLPRGQRRTAAEIRPEWERRYPGVPEAEFRSAYRRAALGVATGERAQEAPADRPLYEAAGGRRRPTGHVRVMVRVPFVDGQGTRRAPIVSVPAQWDWTREQVVQWAWDHAREWEVASRYLPDELPGAGSPDYPEIVGPLDFPAPDQL